MEIKKIVTDHPYLSALGVFVLGIVLVVIFMSDDEAPSEGGVVATMADPNQVAANTQLAMAQLESQAQINAINAQAGVSNQQTAAGIQIAQIQAQSQYNANTLAADVAKSQIAAQADTQKLVSTLSAQVAQGQTQAALMATSINADVQKAIAQMTADTQTKLASTITNQNIELAKVNSATQIATINSMYAAENRRNELAVQSRFAETALEVSPVLYQLGGQYQAYQLQVAAGQAVNGEWKPGYTSVQPSDVSAWQQLGFTYNPATGSIVKA